MKKGSIKSSVFFKDAILRVKNFKGAIFCILFTLSYKVRYMLPYVTFFKRPVNVKLLFGFQAFPFVNPFHAIVLFLYDCVKSVQIRAFFCSVFSRIRIFPHSDWIRRDTEYLSVFSPNVGKYRSKKTSYFDTFHAMYPLQTSENQNIPEFFRRYRKRSMAWNGLMTSSVLIYHWLPDI